MDILKQGSVVQALLNSLHMAGYGVKGWEYRCGFGLHEPGRWLRTVAVQVTGIDRLGPALPGTICGSGQDPIGGAKVEASQIAAYPVKDDSDGGYFIFKIIEN